MSLPVPPSVRRVPLDPETLKCAASRLGQKRWDELVLAQEIREKDPEAERKHLVRSALFAEAAKVVESMVGETRLVPA